MYVCVWTGDEADEEPDPPSQIEASTSSTPVKTSAGLVEKIAEEAPVRKSPFLNALGFKSVEEDTSESQQPTFGQDRLSALVPISSSSSLSSDARTELQQNTLANTKPGAKEEKKITIPIKGDFVPSYLRTNHLSSGKFAFIEMYRP